MYTYLAQDFHCAFSHALLSDFITRGLAHIDLDSISEKFRMKGTSNFHRATIALVKPHTEVCYRIASRVCVCGRAATKGYGYLITSFLVALYCDPRS